MDLQRTKILLDKINSLHQNLLDSKTSVSAIEKKLLMDYLSNMYEAVIDESPATVAKPVIVAKPIVKEVPPKAVVAQPEPMKFVAPTPPLPPPPLPKQEPAIVFTKEPEVKTIPEVKEEPVAVSIPEPTPVKVEKEPDLVFEKPTMTVKEKVGFNGAYDELFTFDESGELSDKLAQSPISNIKKSMGINERYLTINELFDGKAKVFEETVDHLDSLNNFDEARTFLEEDTITKFGWDQPAKVKKTKRFLKLVRSRYL